MSLLTKLIVPAVQAQVVNNPNYWASLLTFNSEETVTTNRVFQIVIIVVNWFLVIVTLVAFIYLVIYGVKYITSGGDAAKATEARNGIINAIIGLIVIALAFFIIRFAVSFANVPANPISPNLTP